MDDSRIAFEYAIMQWLGGFLLVVLRRFRKFFFPLTGAFTVEEHTAITTLKPRRGERERESVRECERV